MTKSMSCTRAVSLSRAAEGGVNTVLDLLATLDALNHRYGCGTMLMASAGLAEDKRAWSMKQERRTPAYTTSLADIPVARA